VLEVAALTASPSVFCNGDEVVAEARVRCLGRLPRRDGGRSGAPLQCRARDRAPAAGGAPRSRSIRRERPARRSTWSTSRGRCPRGRGSCSGGTCVPWMHASSRHSAPRRHRDDDGRLVAAARSPGGTVRSPSSRRPEVTTAASSCGPTMVRDNARAGSRPCLPPSELTPASRRVGGGAAVSSSPSRPFRTLRQGTVGSTAAGLRVSGSTYEASTVKRY
jgi:hypothetical protein